MSRFNFTKNVFEKLSNYYETREFQISRKNAQTLAKHFIILLLHISTENYYTHHTLKNQEIRDPLKRQSVISYDSFQHSTPTFLQRSKQTLLFSTYAEATSTLCALLRKSGQLRKKEQKQVHITDLYYLYYNHYCFNVLQIVHKEQHNSLWNNKKARKTTSLDGIDITNFCFCWQIQRVVGAVVGFF